jgi:hypothetical protein
MQKALRKSQADSESLPSKLVGFSTTKLQEKLFCWDKALTTIETNVLIIILGVKLDQDSAIPHN